MSKIIGIDLGTTNSCCAVMEGGSPKIIANSEGNRTTPSIVAIKDEERLVGQPAKRQAITNPENTIFSSKRFIGRKYDETKQERGEIPFETKKAKNGEIEIILNGNSKKPAEIAAMILQKIKADAESYLGSEVTEAVITVPAYFNDAQRQATKDAGTIAGLEVKRIINEPTAAALAYGVDKATGDKKLVVFDLGGGTFDISILEMSDIDGEKQFEVLATNGDTHLGGDNFDQAIIEHLLAEFKKDTGMDVSEDKMVIQRLKEAAEKAKHELSSSMETDVNLPFLTADSSGPKHLNIKLKRLDLEKLVSDLLKRLEGPCKRALKDSGLKESEIDEVLLVGGMTRMPAVSEVAKKIFGKEPSKGVNPDEVVAMGAAIQGGVLQGDVTDVLLLDVTPLSLSIETAGGIATHMIERNTTIPTSKSQTFSTYADNQTSVEIHITQGERDMATDNKSLGRFILDGIPPSPRGVPQIEVSFDVDANGILKVSANDKATGKTQHITIQGQGGLSDEEIEKMKQEAEKHAESDKKKKESVEVRNTADTLVYSTEKAIKDAGDKVSEDKIKPVQEEIEKVKEILAKADASKEEIEKASKKLSEEAQKIGKELYEAVQEKEGKGTKEGVESKDEKKNDDVVDAEVVEEKNKDEKKKK